jgi:phosphotransferase system HPr-like phosphotransfer protein
MVTLSLAGGQAEAAFGPVGTDFRISSAGTDGDAARSALNAAVAYNQAANEYLVTWAADGLAADNETEIFGQRVSAAGAELGTDFRISNTGTDGDAARDALQPAVAYNATANEYLVTWQADGLATDEESEIFGQRVSAAGAEVGTDFRISNTGTDGDAARDAFTPKVAYNPTTNEYMVVFQADGLATDGETEIFGQRVSAAGAELGTDFRISSVGNDGDATRDSDNPGVAYSSAANEYLVIWSGDGLTIDGESEVFGQRVSAAGAELGTDFRISTVGTDGDVTRGAFTTSVAYNPTANEYLVTWEGDGLALDEEFEVFGQRVSAAGTELGTDFQISNVGTDGDAARDGFGPAVAYSSVANEYLVGFEGDGLATDNETEIFGQRVSAAGAELGTDFRISNVGTDGDAARDAFTAAVAFNPTANEYLATWQADALATDNDTEIFGRRIEGEPAPPPPPVDNAFTIGKLKHRTLSLTVPGAGVIDVNDANASKKKLLLKHSSATASGAGAVKVTLKLTTTAKRKLKQTGKVKVKAAITFTPTGGTANTQTKGLKVKR